MLFHFIFSSRKLELNSQPLVCILSLRSCFLLCLVENETEQEKICPEKTPIKPVERGKSNGNTHIWPWILHAAVENTYPIASLCSFVYLCIHAINNHRSSAMLRARGKSVFTFRELWSDGRGGKREPNNFIIVWTDFWKASWGTWYLSRPSLEAWV